MNKVRDALKKVQKFGFQPIFLCRGVTTGPPNIFYFPPLMLNHFGKKTIMTILFTAKGGGRSNIFGQKQKFCNFFKKRKNKTITNKQ